MNMSFNPESVGDSKISGQSIVGNAKADFADHIGAVWSGTDGHVWRVATDKGPSPWSAVKSDEIDAAAGADGGVIGYLTAKGIDLDKEAKAGTLSERLKEIYIRDSIDEFNSKSNRKLRDIVDGSMDEIPASVKENLDKSVAEIWKELTGKDRPVLSTGTDQDTIGKSIYDELRVLAMLARPDLRTADDAVVREYIEKEFMVPGDDPGKAYTGGVDRFVENSLQFMHQEDRNRFESPWQRK